MARQQKTDVPRRRNAPPVLSEKKYIRGDAEYLRRDYEDGSVDLIRFDSEKKLWLFEVYKREAPLGMKYDFEECLSSHLFYLLYLSEVMIQF